ncbi:MULTISPECIES: hypothetical protein [Bacillus]|uniref:hypothetical protein n=1 Tax=Bacillus TaxID=1386 RepID=UPI001E4D464B|nr:MULTISPECIES: hypothetical protein [Bacillus]MCC8352877.1 hypothetical protein [Bacillus sp. AF23]MCR6598198.1 hypothetical protein [Bacillus halotolerans]MDL5613236.1 hypothetical protein [Bacillus halotolerans]MEC1546690.1 hypothetical protein [Bacillus halotolerans]UTL73584.1 hypothetical protein NLV76_04905 [Bacillus halotolerans]
MSMKTKAAFHLVLFGLACWTLISYFEASGGIGAFFSTRNGQMMFDINITPFILFIAAAAVYIYLQKKSRPASKNLLLPDEFEEQDEREQMMTAKACRASYIAVYFSLPAAAVLLIFYPLFQSHIPFFPIIIVFIIMIIQHISYVISFKKNEKNSGAV